MSMCLPLLRGLILAHPLVIIVVEATIRVRQPVILTTLGRQFATIYEMGLILHASSILAQGLQGLLVEQKPL